MRSVSAHVGAVVTLAGVGFLPASAVGDLQSSAGQVGRPGQLNAVTVIAADDVWAVGSRDGDARYRVATAQHWDGSEWTPLRMPQPCGEANYLDAVAASSATNVWATGWCFGEHSNRGIIMRWNGTSWGQVHFPDADRYRFWGVAPIAPDDVWVSGSGYYPQQFGFVSHWDGTAWHTQRLSAPKGTNLYLGRITAHSSTDVWVAGGTRAKGRVDHKVPMMAHWDGTSWSLHPGPAPDERQNSLDDIDALPSGRVWAVGAYGSERGKASGVDTVHRQIRTLSAEWDGSTWTGHKALSPDTPARLHGVAAVADDDVWAVGQAAVPTPYALLEHWDGVEWTLTSPPSKDSVLYDVDAFDSDDIWAVGARHNGASNETTYIVHWDGNSWERS